MPGTPGYTTPNPTPAGTADGNPIVSANPTPATLNLPGQGEVFRLSSNIDPTGAGGIYYNGPNGLQNLDWKTLAEAKYGANPDQLGGPLNYHNGITAGGQQALKDLYGIDYNSIPEKNYNDLATLQAKGTGMLDPGQLASLLQGGAGNVGAGNKVVNGPGSGAAPASAADVAAQEKNPNWVNPTAQPDNGGAHVPQNMIPTTQPGGNAKNLYDYYSAKGQQLPSWQNNAKTFEAMGLGKASEFTGTAQQNEELLSALQRKDYAATTIGAAPGSGGNSPATNATPAGMSLSAALAGGDASTTLNNYKTYLSTALGVASDKVASSESALSSFFSSQEDPTQILNDAMASAGVQKSQGILSQLDSQISAQSTTLSKLPDDIRTTLANVGVSQAQLDRLVTAETKQPAQILKDLMTQRNALSTEIDKAMTFADKFANTKIAGQASKLAALEWQVTSDKGEYKNLSDDAKTLITNTISDQKSIMTTALAAAKNGADPATIDAILSSSSAGDAILAAGHTLVKPKNTPATTKMSSDITSAGSTLETGISNKGYNGRGPDGYVDPNLYGALYNAAQSQYGSAGAQAFLKKYPPAKNVNPAAVAEGILPTEISNAVTAGQLPANKKPGARPKSTASGTIQ